MAGPFTGKESTPYGAGTVHDFMHAKMCVCDDTTFVGSFNLSRSGEKNAENVLELEDAAIAERLAGYVDEVRARYPPSPSLPVHQIVPRPLPLLEARSRGGSSPGLPISASPIGTTSSGRPSNSSKMRFWSGWPMNALASPSSIAASSTSIISAPASTNQYGTGHVTSVPPVAPSLSASLYRAWYSASFAESTSRTGASAM